MNFDVIRTWLQKYKRDKMAGKCLGAILSLFGAVIVLIVTFWLTYFVVLLASDGFCSIFELFFGTKLKLGNPYAFIISGIFIVMLFGQYLRMDPLSWGRYSKKESDMDPRLKSDLQELVPEAMILGRPGITASFIADLLVTGPRLLFGSVARLKELSKINQIEINKCAEAIAFIYSHADLVSYEEFSAAGWGEQLKQLKNIEGVRFLKVGLLVSDDLRTEFNALNNAPL